MENGKDVADTNYQHNQTNKDTRGVGHSDVQNKFVTVRVRPGYEEDE